MYWALFPHLTVPLIIAIMLFARIWDVLKRWPEVVVLRVGLIIILIIHLVAIGLADYYVLAFQKLLVHHFNVIIVN